VEVFLLVVLLRGGEREDPDVDPGVGGDGVLLLETTVSGALLRSHGQIQLTSCRSLWMTGSLLQSSC